MCNKATGVKAQQILHIQPIGTPAAQLHLIDARSELSITSVSGQRQRSHTRPGITETNWRWSRWPGPAPALLGILSEPCYTQRTSWKIRQHKREPLPIGLSTEIRSPAWKVAITKSINSLVSCSSTLHGRCCEQSSFGQDECDPFQQCLIPAQDVPRNPTCVCQSQTASRVPRSASAAWRHQHRENSPISNHGDLTGSASTESIIAGD